jgi:hypothetical protein
MPTKTRLTVALALLLAAAAGCDTEIVQEQDEDEGRSEVSEGDGEGGGEEDGSGDGDDDDGTSEDGSDDGGSSEEGSTGPGGTGEGGAGGGEPGEGGAGGQGGGTTDPCEIDDGASDPDSCCEGESPWCVEEEGIDAECVDGEWVCGKTPLVVSFDAAEPRMSSLSPVEFDLDGLGARMTTDWPSAETPWLAIDRDGDGHIGDGRELFGSGTALSSGGRARHGFEALAELDHDGNGVVDASDPDFASLALWADRDGDRFTDAGELSDASSGERRLVAIELGYRVDRRCDARGNCGIERAAFRWADAAGEHVGEVVDIHLVVR